MKSKLLFCLLTLGLSGQAQWKYNAPLQLYSIISCENNLYAGLSGGGVYRSRDNGITWVAVNNGIQFGGAYIFSLTSRNDSIYAGGFGEVCFTNDQGENWSLLNLNLPLNSYVYALIVKDNYLFAGVGQYNMDNDNGVYRKQLNGSVWTKLIDGLPANISVNAFVKNNNTLFAGTATGVYKSSNNGNSWTSSNDGISPGINVKSLHVINGNLLAGTTNGIFVSSDNGSNWSYSAGLPESSVVTCFTSNNDIVVAGTYQGAFSSTDNGLTWTDFNDGLPNLMSFYALTTHENYYYAGTGGGIYTTNPNLPTSISENETDFPETRAIYPNPSSSLVTILTGRQFKNATLTIFNLQGQVVKQINNLTEPTVIFHRNDLPAGHYFIRLAQDDKVIISDKLVITDN